MEDPVNKYLSWWTKDPKDPRSTAACQHRAAVQFYNLGICQVHVGCSAKKVLNA